MLTAAPPREPSSPDVRPAGGGAACATCGAALDGPFCSRCGQRVRPRLTLGGVAAEAVQHVLSLDSGLLRTAVDLVRRPAGLITDVLVGRTVRYAGPVRYFLVMVAVAQVLAFVSGHFRGFAEGFVVSFQGTEAERAEALGALDRFWALAFVGLVPFVVAWSRLFLRRSGLTWAEHAVAHLYLLGQVALGVGLTVSLGSVVYDGVGGGAGTAGSLVFVAAPLALYLRASVGVFGRGRVWSPVATALSLGLGFVSYVLVAGTAVALLDP